MWCSMPPEQQCSVLQELSAWCGLLQAEGSQAGDWKLPGDILDVNHSGAVCHQASSAMSCNGRLPVADYYKQKAAKLGPDPLRADADGELLWQKMQISKKPVGAILMDQTAVAGIGNIFRAEILFKV